MRILILICVLSLISKAQNETYFESVNINFDRYLKKSFLPSFETQKKKRLKPVIFGFKNKETELTNITKEKSFSISSFDRNDKLMAAILYGTKYFSTYDFVADDYEKYHTSKDIIMKELLKVKIFVIPDTNSMKKTNEFKINTLETLTQFSHDKLIYLKKPIIISYYSNHEETSEGIQKSTKTKIAHDSKTIYSSIKKGNKNILKHNSKMNEFMFFYNSQHQNKLISGGLMDHILTNLLCEIKNNVHLKALNVSRLSDVYENNLLDLKRISDRGRLIFNQNFRPIRKFIN
jgi:hypothetical protein